MPAGISPAVKGHGIYREGPAGVVSWCQAVERSGRIFEDGMCDGNMLSRAPEIRIVLVNDIMSGLI